MMAYVTGTGTRGVCWQRQMLKLRANIGYIDISKCVVY